MTAMNTYKTFLMVSDDGSTYSKLIDIVECPDLGQAPDTLDATTLSDPQKIYILDIKDTGGLEFTANYTKTDYETIAALDDGETHHFAVWFGATESGTTVTPDGSDGKFTFDGYISVWAKGASVSNVRQMGIMIAPTTEIVES